MATLSDTHLDRGLPASLEAERSILGAILLDNDSTTRPPRSSPTTSFSTRTAASTSACSRLVRHQPPHRHRHAEPRSCRHKELDAVGGVAYLASLTDGVPRRLDRALRPHRARQGDAARPHPRRANAIMPRRSSSPTPPPSVIDRAESRSSTSPRTAATARLERIAHDRPGVLRRRSRQALPARRTHHRPARPTTPISTS